MKTFRKMLFIALIDALTLQVYLDLFSDDFRISLAVLILPIFYYFDEELNPLFTGFLVGIVGLLFRSILGAGAYGSVFNALIIDYQIIAFDIVYALIYYFMYYKTPEKNMLTWIFAITFADFFGNVMELTVRQGIHYEELLYVTTSLLTIAIVRTIIATIIVYGIMYYNVMRNRSEQQTRYIRLLQLFSDLRGEIFFMKSNMDYVENVMADAYVLYDSLPSDLKEEKELSLKITKDVHEIKKNYERVIKGIELASQDQKSLEHLKFSDLVNLLIESAEKEIALKEVDIQIERNYIYDIYVRDHFLMMSVLRNLIWNAMEAMITLEKGNLIKISLELENENAKIVIVDNGPGIKERDQKVIFDPGFSTKFDKSTGNIFRGVGLTLVKEIVEDSFKGTILVESNWGFGTTVKIVIPKGELEEEYELLSD